MSNFALLWSKMLLSSLWVTESKETRLVWVTMLMLKDVNGIVSASILGLADAAKVSPEECREALRVLTSADPNDTSKTMDGRRLIAVPGGWQIVNHEMYRYSTEAKREYWRQKKAEQRAKNPARKKDPIGHMDEQTVRRGWDAVKQAVEHSPPSPPQNPTTHTATDL